MEEEIDRKTEIEMKGHEALDATYPGRTVSANVSNMWSLVHKRFMEYKTLEKTEGVENLIQDPDSYDTKGLCVDKNALWALSISHIGDIGEALSAAEGRAYSVNPTDDGRYLVSLIENGGKVRIWVPSEKFPSSRFIEGVLRKGMASPQSPMQPGLPASLMMRREFHPIINELQPFLNLLSETQWAIETQCNSDETKRNIKTYRRNIGPYLLNAAKSVKLEGDAAYASRNHSLAKEKYTEAIRAIIPVVVQDDILEGKDKGEAKQLLAVLYGNRSATWLLDGEGMDPPRAFCDAASALDHSPDYSTAYIRQAQALLKLNGLDDAMEVLRGALRRPSLANDSSLVDLLIDLQTSGKGLPDDVTDMKEWLAYVFRTQAARGEEAKSIGGEWKRRVEAPLRAINER